MEKEKEKFPIHDTKAVDATVSRAGNEYKKPKDHDFSVLKATKKKVATDMPKDKESTDSSVHRYSSELEGDI